jgi:hypothetical protein
MMHVACAVPICSGRSISDHTVQCPSIPRAPIVESWLELAESNPVVPDDALALAVNGVKSGAAMLS